MAPIQTWAAFVKAAGATLYDLVLLIVFISLAAFSIGIFLPAYQCYTPRAKVSELFLSASAARAEIGNRARKNNSLQGTGVGLQIASDRRAKAGIVTNDGIIIVASEDPPAVVILLPTLDRETINWKCVGFPAKYMPSPCRK